MSNFGDLLFCDHRKTLEKKTHHTFMALSQSIVNTVSSIYLSRISTSSSDTDMENDSYCGEFAGTL